MLSSSHKRSHFWACSEGSTKHADWVWSSEENRALAMIDGCRFLEENRPTEHASVWKRSASLAEK